MASEKQDEEYLETLFNSIINGEEEKNLSAEKGTDEESEYLEGLETAELTGQNTEGESETLTQSENAEDNTYADSVQDIADSPQEETKQNTDNEGFDNSEWNGESNIIEEESEPEAVEENFDKWLEDEVKKEDLSNEIDVEKVLNDENNDIGEIINSMYSDAEDRIPDIDDAVSGVDSNLTDIDNLINSDISSNGKKKEKKEKKDSFFKKLFSEKEKTNDQEELNEEKILSETGSTAEDMSKLGLKNDKNLFEELDKLDSLEEAEKMEKKEQKKEKRKKEKKNKTKKKAKTPKEKELKIRKKKEKPLVREEIIRFSPVSVVLMITIIAVVVFGVYFGAGIFTYNSKINKASSYYVDKEYDKAYDVLAGMDLKESEEGLYNQVLNIMKVEKHMNDFQTYIEIELYANALESLIKGVENYDANIGESNTLGTTEILNTILNNIDAALQNYYGLTVEDARTIIQIGNKSEIAKIINDKSLSVKAGNS